MCDGGETETVRGHVGESENEMMCLFVYVSMCVYSLMEMKCAINR